MYIPGFNPYLINEFTGGSPEYVGIPDLGMGAFSPPQQFNPIQPVRGLETMSAPPQQFNPIQPTQPMGVLPPAAQPFQQVQAPMPAPAPMPAAAPMPAPAPMPATRTSAGGVPYRVIPINEQRTDAPGYGNPATSGFGETFDESLLANWAIGPEDNPFYVGMRGDTLGLDPRTNKNSFAGFVPLTAGSQYALVDNRTGEIVSAGAGEQGFMDAITAAQSLSGEGGKKANWSLMAAEPDGQFRQVAQDKPDKSLLGSIADVALPVAGAALVPGLGLVASKALGAGLGAAAGSGLSSVAQGRALDEVLLRAGVSGLGAAGGAALGKAVAPALSKGAAPVIAEGGTQALAQAGTQAASSAIPEILVQRSLGALTGQALGSAAGSTLSNLASMPAGRGADQVFEQPTTPAVSPPQGALPGNEIVVPGTLPTPAAPTPPLAPAVASGLSGLASSLGNAAANVAPTPSSRPPVEITPEGDLVLTGTPTAPPTTPAVNPGWVLDNGFWRSTSAPSPFAPAPTPSQQPAPFRDPETGDLVLTGTPTAPGGALPFASAGAGTIASIAAQVAGLTGGTPPQQPVEQPVEQEDYQGEIPVLGTKQIGGVPISPGLTFDDFGNLTNIDVEKAIQLKNQQKSEDRFPVVPDAPTDGGVDPEAKKRITTEEILKYLRAAGLLSAVIGGGGGGRGSLGTIPGGLGSGFSSVFSGSLPRATLPGAATGFAPRDPSSLRPQTTQDWYRYGYGPEQSFFSYVPQGEENKSKAFTGYYEGGDVSGPTGALGMTSESFAVNGPGTGRSDEIPALLSDGEYVIDAETVALLGDGSSKAGAERLDQFRINLRRDKGRKLAKGDFSVNAKRPEQYMKGGRA